MTRSHHKPPQPQPGAPLSELPPAPAGLDDDAIAAWQSLGSALVSEQRLTAARSAPLAPSQ